jgi:hypothetical protein
LGVTDVPLPREERRGLALDGLMDAIAGRFPDLTFD